ncbi:MAG: GNAT family N-acetyltransferase [Saprospiraceae bacterium]|nr:GNAT family N-acetyltransferase [Saprospiraceae bacterium]
MEHLETERLRFRLWKNSDFPALAEFYAKEENARFVGGVKKGEVAWRLMATYLGHYLLKGYSYLAIEEKASGKLMGTVGLWNSEPWPEPEMGYWLVPEGQGKGYGVEAGRVVKDFAKNDLQLPSLVSYIDPTNEPSKKLARRLGATYDGTVQLLEFGLHEVHRYF